MPAADDRGTWQCPDCKQIFHVINGRDHAADHAPHCATPGAGQA